MIEGSYLTNNKRDIIIGKKLADKLEVEVGDKVVAMANTLKGSIGSEVCPPGSGFCQEGKRAARTIRRIFCTRFAPIRI